MITVVFQQAHTKPRVAVVLADVFFQQGLI